MTRPLIWQRDGLNWPHREASRFIEVGNISWHVQVMGDGPALLLLHGTGASSHSWRGIMPLLAKDYTVIAPDLPGHAFTAAGAAQGRSLGAIGGALTALLAALDRTPVAIGGHSAGVVIALHLAAQSRPATPVIGYAPALMPFEGLGEHLFPAMARLLLLNPFAPRIFSGMARIPGEAERFLSRATGSRIDETGLACYEALFANTRHCQGALAMMAHWDLTAFSQRLPGFRQKIALFHGERDKAVPLASVEKAARLLPSCTLEVMTGLGHLAHEERPTLAAQQIAAFADGGATNRAP